jgi:hypothetical protein
MESFLELSSGISQLNMIKIMDILHEKKIPIPKNIDQWLLTTNASVIKLGLKIMVYYNYRSSAKEIIELIQLEDNSVKKEALIAIRELFLIEAKEDILRLFDQVTPELKIEILDTLKVIGDESMLSFLENIISYETNKDLKLKAVDCLNEIDKTGLDVLATQNNDTSKMTKHVRAIYI